MKHKLVDDVNVNVNIDIPAEEVSMIIDKITDSAVTIIVVATAAHILKRWIS